MSRSITDLGVGGRYWSPCVKTVDQIVNKASVHLHRILKSFLTVDITLLCSVYGDLGSMRHVD